MKTYVGDTNNLSVNAKKVYCGYNNKALTLPIVETGDKRIFGAVWDGSADTFWTRTDDSRGWQDPNPYYAGMNGTPSSPCDDIMPWAGMVKSEHPQAGTVVAIPKFYYKMGYVSGTTGLKIQISNYKHDGFKTSPAHMDRGDGNGERDVIYVGRYHCASDYTSKTEVSPINNITRSTARTAIHNLGSTIWQIDFATWQTIWMLYLVEFADWNSQSKIGGGCSTSGVMMNMGYTDSMPYHTGTTATSISATVYGGTQYRNIEGLWDDLADWCDGIYHSGTAVYGILNPTNFSDSTGGTNVGTRPTSSGYISKFVISSVTDFTWLIYPSETSGSATTYICDEFRYSAGDSSLRVGGSYTNDQTFGLFRLANSTYSGENCGARLMVLPNVA